MYGQILVPLDGSALAEQVLPYVRILAARLRTPVTLLRAFGSVPGEPADPNYGLYVEQVVEGIRTKAQNYLEKVRTGLKDLGVPIAISVLEGGPARHIIQEAERTPDTLITMCTHGRSGMSRWLLGSTTEKVLLAASSPLLVLRSRTTVASPSAASLKTVVVPLDGSPLAEQVLPYVTWLASALYLKVHLARVVSRPGDYYSDIGTRMPYALPGPENLDEEASNYLGNVSNKLRSEGTLSRVECTVLHGHPAGAIIDFAKVVPDNLVALTTHGRSGIERWVMGSVADRVVRYCGDPVLVVRTR